MKLHDMQIHSIKWITIICFVIIAEYVHQTQRGSDSNFYHIKYHIFGNQPH